MQRKQHIKLNRGVRDGTPFFFLCPNLRFKVSDSDTQGGVEWLH